MWFFSLLSIKGFWWTGKGILCFKRIYQTLWQKSKENPIFHDKAPFRFTAETFALYIICYRIFLLCVRFSVLHLEPENSQTIPININNHASFHFRCPALLDSTITLSHSMYCKLTLSPFSMTCCHLEFVCIWHPVIQYHSILYRSTALMLFVFMFNYMASVITR